jgi:hypothetical protein
MAIKTFTTGEVLTASDTNTYLANSGLVYVSTTTWSGSLNTIPVTGCFSATYDNYLISFSNITSTGGNGGTINYKLMSGSTPSSTLYYGNTFYIVTAAAGTMANAPFSNGPNGEAMSISTSTTNAGVLQLQSPYLAQYTRSQHMSADNNYVRWNSMIHQSATSYDGIQFLTSAGTVSGGTITVYGYRKA